MGFETLRQQLLLGCGDGYRRRRVLVAACEASAAGRLRSSPVRGSVIPPNAGEVGQPLGK